jgi:timeless
MPNMSVVNKAKRSTFQSSLTVEESVVNELLLVCGVIGTTTTTTTTAKTKDNDNNANNDDDDDEDDDDETTTNEEERLVPVADCLLWLQDLQRVLRRDEDAYRPIALLLASWNIVPTKLLPLLKSAHYDSAMVMTLVKILVILTKPLTDSAKKAARMVIDVKAAKKQYPDDAK